MTIENFEHQLKVLKLKKKEFAAMVNAGYTGIPNNLYRFLMLFRICFLCVVSRGIPNIFLTSLLPSISLLIIPMLVPYILMSAILQKKKNDSRDNEK